MRACDKAQLPNHVALTKAKISYGHDSGPLTLETPFARPLGHDNKHRAFFLWRGGNGGVSQHKSQHHASNHDSHRRITSDIHARRTPRAQRGGQSLDSTLGGGRLLSRVALKEFAPILCIVFESHAKDQTSLTEDTLLLATQATRISAENLGTRQTTKSFHKFSNQKVRQLPVKSVVGDPEHVSKTHVDQRRPAE